MFAAVIADQQNSRTRADLVPEALDALASIPAVLPFERAAGDEIQGLLSCDQHLVDAIMTLTRGGGWRIGIGLGPVTEPLPASTRAARGPAYLAARDAVESARRAPGELRVRAQPPLIDAPGDSVRVSTYDLSEGIEATLAALVWIRAHRSSEGWQVSDMMDAGVSRRQIADRLNISASAVSQRLRRAGWAEEQQLRALAVALVTSVGSQGSS